ncbi:hypothetical protein Vafri_14828 [Volvox africanus]|uniref:Uncharacterized protein n=1 Tax=Volvox africanus TaxID=51714 RepID=A0A8J4BFE7_9CHLO|nr:hypothetical protein Vafri_14828 [Volvox africanus]
MERCTKAPGRQSENPLRGELELRNETQGTRCSRFRRSIGRSERCQELLVIGFQAGVRRRQAAGGREANGRDGREANTARAHRSISRILVKEPEAGIKVENHVVPVEPTG